jgi:hypothetical protein
MYVLLHLDTLRLVFVSMAKKMAESQKQKPSDGTDIFTDGLGTRINQNSHLEN